ncbi:GATA-type zinc finger protein 1 [Macrotis lagotis]|uniref:GATA-type zinc finger protein 1 n=1 Tax=Macrotis lagotis TaxID=92651 RepID=UPI003D6945D7
MRTGLAGPASLAFKRGGWSVGVVIRPVVARAVSAGAGRENTQQSSPGAGGPGGLRPSGWGGASAATAPPSAAAGRARGGPSGAPRPVPAPSPRALEAAGVPGLGAPRPAPPRRASGGLGVAPGPCPAPARGQRGATAPSLAWAPRPWGRAPDSAACSPRSPWPALPAAARGLRLLQETAERPPQPPAPGAPRAEPWLEPPPPLTAPRGPGAWHAGDPLALFSLQCRRPSPPRARKPVGLGGGPGRGPGGQALARRSPRKQPHPRRGAEGLEPGFQGAVLRMHLKPDREGHQLLITARFSSACGSRTWGASPSAMGVSTSSHQDSPGSRCCASCRTQRTPLWRDAEDGTPLCNACGIRYKKYGIHCPACWIVPRKSICPLGHCTRCGAWLCTPQGPGRKGTEGNDSSVRARMPRLHGEKEKSFPRETSVKAGEGAGIPTNLGHSPDEMWIPVPVGRPEQ